MEKLLSILVHAHSGWRWVVLILLLTAIGMAYSGWKSKKEFTPKHKKVMLFTLIAFHLQWTFGLILYFISPKVQFVPGMMKVTLLRFFAIEHIFGMTIAMILITVGYSKAKKIVESDKKFKKLFVFFLIALLIILATIPWPFRTELLSKWF